MVRRPNQSLAMVNQEDRDQKQSADKAAPAQNQLTVGRRLRSGGMIEQYGPDPRKETAYLSQCSGNACDGKTFSRSTTGRDTTRYARGRFPT